MPKPNKRENFDVTPEQAADIDCLQAFMRATSRKDAIMRAVQVTLQLATESRQGKKLFLGTEQGQGLMRVMMFGLEQPNVWPWKYLVELSHPWKKQLFVKGRKLPAANVWSAMLVNELTREQAADNWDLPLEAINEIVDYCESNQPLLEMEAAEEAKRLAQKGIDVESQAAHR